MLEQFQEEHADQVRLVYRHFPLDFHDKANLSAQAAEAAGKQGAFFKMKKLLFAEQASWAGLTPADFETWVADKAASLGLDRDQFVKDMNSDETVQKVKAAFDEAMNIGLSGTPFLFINGIPYQGARDPAALEGLLATMERSFKECPPQTIDPNKSYTATLQTSKGDIVIRLFAKQAPITVNNFVFLARSGWYDGVPFHRVMTDFVAQSGDPSGTGVGGPGYAFGNEINPELKFDKAGMVGMANAGPDRPASNGSQFFITYAPLPDLNGKYPIFGEVTQGMDVLKALNPQPAPSGSPALPADTIRTVTIEEK